MMIKKGRTRRVCAILCRVLIPCALLAVAATVLASLIGCHAAPTAARTAKAIPRPDPVPTLTAHQVKDATITAAANRIDTLALDAPQKPAIATETALVRQAIATAPAAQIATLSDRYTAALDAQAAQAAQLTAQLAKEELKAKAKYKRYLYASAGSLMLAFTITVIFGRAAAAARTWPLAALALAAIALCEAIGTPAFQIGCLALLAAAIAYATYWVIDRHRQGTLAAKLQTRAAALRDIVTTLDEAYDNATDDIKRVLDRNIFDRLSDRFADNKKAEIHDIRKEATTHA